MNPGYGLISDCVPFHTVPNRSQQSLERAFLLNEGYRPHNTLSRVMMEGLKKCGIGKFDICRNCYVHLCSPLEAMFLTTFLHEVLNLQPTAMLQFLGFQQRSLPQHLM